MAFKPIISVGFSKDGEVDFMVDSAVYDLDAEQLNQLAAMCFAAFHAAYCMRNNHSQDAGEKQQRDYEETKAKTGFVGSRPGRTWQTRS